MNAKFKPATPEELAARGILPDKPVNSAPAQESSEKDGSLKTKAPAKKTAQKAT